VRRADANRRRFALPWNDRARTWGASRARARRHLRSRSSRAGGRAARHALSPRPPVVGERRARRPANAPVAAPACVFSFGSTACFSVRPPRGWRNRRVGQFQNRRDWRGRQRCRRLREGSRARRGSSTFNVEPEAGTGEIVLRLRRGGASVRGRPTDVEPLAGRHRVLGMGRRRLRRAHASRRQLCHRSVARGAAPSIVPRLRLKEQIDDSNRSRQHDRRAGLVSSLGSAAGRVTMGGKPLAAPRAAPSRTETSTPTRSNTCVRGSERRQGSTSSRTAPSRALRRSAGTSCSRRGRRRPASTSRVKYSASISPGRVRLTATASPSETYGQLRRAEDPGSRPGRPRADGDLNAPLKGGREYKPKVHVGLAKLSKLRVVEGEGRRGLNGSDRGHGRRIGRYSAFQFVDRLGTTIDGEGQPLVTCTSTLPCDGATTAPVNRWIRSSVATVECGRPLAIDLI